METEDKPQEVKKTSEVKIEKSEKPEEKPNGSRLVNMVTVAAGAFGLATFDVKDMILGGSVKIDGKDWRPKDGNFDIRLDEIDGREIEIISSPKSIKFTLDYKQLNEYRTSSPE